MQKLFQDIARQGTESKMRLHFFQFAFLFITWGVNSSHASQAVVFDVHKYGAKADGKTDNSKAFAAAWNAACASTRPSIVYVRKGKYLLNPVAFTGPCKNNNMTFQLVGGLFASTNNNLYSGYWLQFESVNRLTFEGGGYLNAQGASWWAQSCTSNDACSATPVSLIFFSSTNVIVRDIKSINSKHFHIAFLGCNRVEAKGLTIRAPEDSPNTDGIHVEQSSNVKIIGVKIGTGDDCISIGPGCSNIFIHGVQCGPGHGISVGSLGKASDNGAGVSDVTVEKASFSGTQNGFRIKTWQGGQGFAKNITFQNAKMVNVSNPIIIDQNYCPYSHSCSSQGSSAVAISKVSYTNITGTSATQVAISLSCAQNVPCQGIELQNVELRYRIHGVESAQAQCQNAKGTEKGVVQPHNCL